MYRLRAEHVATGERRNPRGRRVTVEFDDDTFATIKARAKDHNTSFGEQVRLLVEWGLEEGAR